MKTFLQLLLVSLLLTAASPLVQAQQLSDANELFDIYQFEEASKIYLRIVQKNQRGKEQATERLADCYRILGNKAEAEKWYAAAVDYPDATNRINFNYGIVLRDLGKYAEAKEQFVKYAAQAPGDLRGNLYASYMDQLVAWSKEEAEKGSEKPDRLVAVNLADLNTEFVDVGATRFGSEGIAFASARPTDPKKKKRLAEKLKMWETTVAIAEGKLPTFAEPKLLLPVTRATSNIIQGPASFTADGKTMFYTQSYIVDDGYGGQIEGLEIMYCTFDGKAWSKPESFTYNSKEFNNAHPTISADGKMLIYSSDMSGGYGATDIYMSRLSGERWEKPRNLGANINTAEVEKYPILLGDSVLYFSSNGHVTLGGQDIMKSVYRNGAWTKAENMRAPINSLDDDVCFAPLRDEQFALFSSAREGGKGDLDIYVLCAAAIAEAKDEAASDTLAVPQPEAPAATTVAEAKQPEPEKVEPAPQPEVKKEEPKKEEPAPQPEVKKEEPKKEEVKPVEEPKKEEVEAVPVAVVVPAPAPAPVVVAPKKEEPAPQPEVKKEEPKKEEPKKAEPAPQPEVKKEEPKKEEPKKAEPAPQPEVKKEEPKKAEPAPRPEVKKEEPQKVAPAPVAQQLENKPEQVPLAANFNNIYFDKNSIYPSKKSYGTIGSLLVYLKKNPNVNVHFEVFSDAQGAEEVNMEVSERRAKILADYMQQQGVAAKRITTAAYGDARPVNTCKKCSEAQHAENRRAEVSLHEGQGRGAAQSATDEEREVEAQTVRTASDKNVSQFRNIGYAKNSLYPDKSSYANIGNLIAFMRANPNAVVVLDVHSDAQGSENANKKVSDERAKILSSYLQQNQIGEKRIVLRSHGSSRPLNKCSAGVPCTEAEHALNRRVEISIKY